MYKFARAVRPKYRLSYLSRLRCLNNKVFITVLEGWPSQDEGAGRVEFLQVLSPWWQAAIFSGDLSFLNSPHSLVPLCVSKSVLTRGVLSDWIRAHLGGLVAASLQRPSPYTERWELWASPCNFGELFLRTCCLICVSVPWGR